MSVFPGDDDFVPIAEPLKDGPEKIGSLPRGTHAAGSKPGKRNAPVIPFHRGVFSD
jgi:hypothetical protein